MTGLSAFTPGGELQCSECPFRTGFEPDPGCIIATEMRAEGETMTPECCAIVAAAVLLHDLGGES